MDRATPWLLKALHNLSFTPFLEAIMQDYEVLPRQIVSKEHHIITCFPQICARHWVQCTVELFWHLFTIRDLPPKFGWSFMMIQSRGLSSSILNLPENNKGWKNRFFSVLYEWELPVPNVCTSQYYRHSYIEASEFSKRCTEAIYSEFYEYPIFWLVEDYVATDLEGPNYNMLEKIIP